ncbi:hypothetical protein GCM10007338_06720 [Corynebacterium pelargi]|nr:hypothetical protein GCM10007338_06720 [Corynebacterium pelargi]
MARKKVTNTHHALLQGAILRHIDSEEGLEGGGDKRLGQAVITLANPQQRLGVEALGAVK